MLVASSKVLPQIPNIVDYDILLATTAVGVGLYFVMIFQTRLLKIIAAMLCFGGIIHFLFRDVILKSYSSFDSMGFYLVSIYIVILVFIWFRQYLQNIATRSILLNFDFWVVISLFIYHLGAFTIFLSLQALSKLVSVRQDNINIGNLWAAQNIFLFLSSLTLIAGVLWTHFLRK